MSGRAKPPFRADHVGSLIRPPELIAAREARARGAMDDGTFLEIQQSAIRDVVRMQEETGLKAVTDGEYNRTTWQTDFLLKFDNVTQAPSKFTIKFHSEQGDREGKPVALHVAGKLGRQKGIFVRDFEYLKRIAHATAKITLPSPSVMHFRGGRDAIDLKTYPDMAEFYRDLARVYREEIADLAASGCRYLQLDEVNFAYLCDPALRGEVRSKIGEDPERLPKTYAALINDTISACPEDMIVCLHICRGNFAGNWVAEGGYDPVAEVLFNEIRVEGYFLEYDSPRAGSFEPLRFLPKGKMAVLGLVTTKKGTLESKDELRRRIDQAARYVPMDQLALSPQCGFSSGIGGNTMTIDEQRAKLRLIVDVARDVWGSL